MKRDPNLVPLSHDHQVTLERALRLRRASDDDLLEVVEQLAAHLAERVERHFALEEELLLPLVPDEARADGERMVAEHGEIRAQSRALIARPDVEAAHRLGELLHGHVRFEERELFPAIERAAEPARLAEVGARLGAR